MGLLFPQPPVQSWVLQVGSQQLQQVSLAVSGCAQHSLTGCPEGALTAGEPQSRLHARDSHSNKLCKRPVKGVQLLSCTVHACCKGSLPKRTLLCRKTAPQGICVAAQSTTSLLACMFQGKTVVHCSFVALSARHICSLGVSRQNTICSCSSLSRASACLMCDDPPHASLAE